MDGEVGTNNKQDVNDDQPGRSDDQAVGSDDQDGGSDDQAGGRYDKAGGRYDKAGERYNQTGGRYGKAGGRYDQARGRYDQARGRYDQAGGKDQDGRSDEEDVGIDEQTVGSDEQTVGSDEQARWNRQYGSDNEIEKTENADDKYQRPQFTKRNDNLVNIAQNKRTQDTSTNEEDMQSKKYSEMVHKIITSSTGTDEILDRRFSIQQRALYNTTKEEISADLRTHQRPSYSASTDDGLTKKFRIRLEDDRYSYDDQEQIESSISKYGEQSSYGEYTESYVSRPKMTMRFIHDTPWQEINVLRDYYERAASREKKMKERLNIPDVETPPNPLSPDFDDRRKSKKKPECTCKLGEPQNMYAKGHDVSCKVWYPTQDPCVFADAPNFRGSMRFTHPCGKSPPRRKAKPLFETFYRKETKPHYRHTLLVEDLRRIERERTRVRGLTQWQRKAHTNRLREQMPVLGRREIRQFRHQFHEWVILELKETDFRESAEFVRYLLRTSRRLSHGPDDLTHKWEDLRLEDYPDVAKILVKSLVAYETYSKATPPNLQSGIEELILISIKLMGIAPGFYWLVEEVLLRAIHISSRYKRDSSQKEALVRYVYGYLLAEKLSDHTRAIEQLEQSRSLSLSKNWNIGYSELEPHYKNFNLQCTYYLCRVMIQRAKDIRTIDTLTSIKLLSKALRFLGDPILVETQATVLLELGISYEMIGEFRMAHVVMQRYLEIPNRSLEPPGKCSAYLEMAFCHRLLGENKTAEAYLRETLRTAKESQSRELNAVAHKYVGIGYLAMGYNKKASVHMEHSFRGFKELNLNTDMDYVRVVAAIAKGSEVLPHMAELLNETVDEVDGTALVKLAKWMNRHLPFWDENGEEVPELYGPELYNVIRTRNVDWQSTTEPQSARLAPGSTLPEGISVPQFTTDRQDVTKPPDGTESPDGDDYDSQEALRDCTLQRNHASRNDRPGKTTVGQVETTESLMYKRGGSKWLPRKDKGQKQNPQDKKLSVRKV